MTTPFDDLERGDPVLLRFVSRFNKEVTQTVAGVVADHPRSDNDFADLVIEDGGEDHYFVTWDGGVERQRRDETGVWDSYGGNARLWLLDPVDMTYDVPEEDLNAGDKRAVDPLLDTDRARSDEIVYQEE